MTKKEIYELASRRAMMTVETENSKFPNDKWFVMITAIDSFILFLYSYEIRSVDINKYHEIESKIESYLFG